MYLAKYLKEVIVMELKEIKTSKYMKTFWKIWWIGLALIFIVVLIQTLISKFG